MRALIELILVIMVILSCLQTQATQTAFPECNKSLTGDLSAAAKEIKQVLYSVARQFCIEQTKANYSWRKLKITSIQRTVEAQAGYMLSCLASGCRVYENQPAVAEYQALPVKTKETIAAVIKDQINRNCYISKHLSNRAVDIGTAGHSQAEIERLKKIIKATNYKVNEKYYTAWIEDRSHGTGPHLHLNFEPYGFVADQCSKK